MKKFTILFLFICSLLSHTYIMASVGVEEAYAKLQKLGFENIQVSQDNNTTYVALEDNIYRGNFRGYGAALEALCDNTDSSTDIVLILLDNQMPKIELKASHKDGKWTVNGNYPSSESYRHLKHKNKVNSSLGKVDFVFTPIVEVDSFLHDTGYKFCIDIAPAMEMTLWKGAKLTAQVVIPIYNNMGKALYTKDQQNLKTQYDYVRPGTITLSQELVSNKHFDITLTGGLFHIYQSIYSNNQYGFDFQADYHLLNNLDLGLQAGYTGDWYLKESKWTFDPLKNYSVLGKIKFYEPYTNLQIVATGGRYVFGDYGARMDIVQRLAEYSIGIYGAINKDNENGFGFFCSIPIGPKKKMKRYPVRISLAESMHWEHTLQNEEGVYTTKKHNTIYTTLPGGDYSPKYWQPQYVAKYVQKYLNKSIK